ERGKEFFPVTREVTVAEQPLEVKIPLQRWIDLAGRGWFSGDTHVHRPSRELANLLPAEDVNIAFPMTYWTTEAELPPNRGNKNFKGEFAAAPVKVDVSHSYYPLNTEYEIFTTGKRSHTLGAL